jgi:hypothetical protein
MIASVAALGAVLIAQSAATPAQAADPAPAVERHAQVTSTLEGVGVVMGGPVTGGMGTSLDAFGPVDAVAPSSSPLPKYRNGQRLTAELPGRLP